MTSKAIDKTSKTNRSATPRRTPGKKVASLPGGGANTTAQRSRKAPTKQLIDERTTKHAALLQLLKQPSGTTIPEMMQATGWQQHSVRGFLAGTVKKKLGLALTSSKVEGEHRRYLVATPRRGR
ncbi:MAG: DUF3489 domain-containing protein [Hyphomicrobiaceae bacterium]